MFSVIQDQQSSELSQGHIARRAKRLKVDQQELKLPRVVALDACQVSLSTSFLSSSPNTEQQTSQ
jgi:U3 small nucleolar RNA-associated protein 21